MKYIVTAYMGEDKRTVICTPEQVALLFAIPKILVSKVDMYNELVEFQEFAETYAHGNDIEYGS